MLHYTPAPIQVTGLPPGNNTHVAAFLQATCLEDASNMQVILSLCWRAWLVERTRVPTSFVVSLAAAVRSSMWAGQCQFVAAMAALSKRHERACIYTRTRRSQTIECQRPLAVTRVLATPLAPQQACDPRQSVVCARACVCKCVCACVCDYTPCAKGRWPNASWSILRGRELNPGLPRDRRKY